MKREGEGGRGGKGKGGGGAPKEMDLVKKFRVY
jgi:hypothetical protein